jgi:hypothetical protein
MKEPISGRVEREIKQTIQDEAPLRGHTVSEAMDIILKLGLQPYLKKHPKKYEPVNNQQAA